MTQEEGTSISYHNEDVNFELKASPLISNWIKKVIQQQKCHLVYLNFIFCSDPFLHQINLQYLDHNTYTDVITFPYSNPPEIEGDIFISIDRIRENAQKFKTPFEEELNRVMIHGVLHLCGFHDKDPDDKIRMTSQENTALQLLNSIKEGK